MIRITKRETGLMFLLNLYICFYKFGEEVSPALLSSCLLGHVSKKTHLYWSSTMWEVCSTIRKAKIPTS